MKCDFKFILNSKHSASTSVNLHKHGCYELVYYLTGSGKTMIKSKDFSYTSGTFAIISPNTLHDERHAERSDMLFVGFTYDGNDICLKDNIYSDTDSKSILTLLNQIKDEASKQRIYYESKLYHLINELLIEFARISGTTKTKSKDFSYAKNFVEEHYNQRIELATLAELCGYSYHHFRHLFKEKMGMSPQSYIINQRITNAKKLLTETRLSILDISQECGFSNESQFSSIFKRASGKTPTFYRKTTA